MTQKDNWGWQARIGMFIVGSPKTVREKLPEGFQRAEYLLEHGILDMVVRRTEMAATLGRLIGLLCVKDIAVAA